MVALLLFVLGCVFGSFFLVIGTRLPREEDVLYSRSRCDNCGHELKIWDLIPIFSFLFLGGKCRYCKKKIDPLTIIVELSTGFLYMYAFLRYQICYEMFIFIILISLLTVIFISDFKYFIINDSPLIVCVILVLIAKWYYLGVSSLLSSVLGGFGLFFTMLLIKVFGDKMFKRESLGGGDIKLSFVMGFVLGFPHGLCALILSCFLALPYSVATLMLKKNNEVPYGPFLASSLLIVFMFMIKFTNLLDLIVFKF